MMKIGDLVKLMSGGPPMVVSHFTTGDDDAARVHTKWFADQDLCREAFRPYELVLMLSIDPQMIEHLNGFDSVQAMVAAGANASIEERADFLVVDGKVGKDRHGTGTWPPMDREGSNLPVPAIPSTGHRFSPREPAPVCTCQPNHQCDHCKARIKGNE